MSSRTRKQENNSLDRKLNIAGLSSKIIPEEE